MSWGALPWWVYELESERQKALTLCCFESEWVPEWSRAVDLYTYNALQYIREHNE